MSNLEGLHPYIRFKAEKLVRMAKEIGLEIIITQGLRTIEYQNSLYAQGRTEAGKIVTNAKGGYSFHNFGLAFDYAVLKVNGKEVDWNTSADVNKDGEKDWYQIGKLGQSIGLVWGGDWDSDGRSDDETFLDLPHFQATFGLTTAQLRAGKKPPYPCDPEVVEFQKILNHLGACIEVDGIYGDGSINAVKELQKKFGLAADGIVGTETYSKFISEASPNKQVKSETTISEKIMWGKTELKKGQIGRLTVIKPINLWKDVDGELVFERILNPTEQYRVYKYRNDHGGQYGVGSAMWVTKMDGYIQYETPSKKLLAKLNGE